MKKSKFSASQIVAILKEGEAGVPVTQLSVSDRYSAEVSFEISPVLMV